MYNFIKIYVLATKIQFNFTTDLSLDVWKYTAVQLCMPINKEQVVFKLCQLKKEKEN